MSSDACKVKRVYLYLYMIQFAEILLNFQLISVNCGLFAWKVSNSEYFQSLTSRGKFLENFQCLTRNVKGSKKKKKVGAYPAKLRVSMSRLCCKLCWLWCLTRILMSKEYLRSSHNSSYNLFNVGKSCFENISDNRYCYLLSVIFFVCKLNINLFCVNLQIKKKTKGFYFVGKKSAMRAGRFFPFFQVASPLFFKGRQPLRAVKGAIKINKTLLSIDPKRRSSVGSACQKGLREFTQRESSVPKAEKMHRGSDGASSQFAKKKKKKDLYVN